MTAYFRIWNFLLSLMTASLWEIGEGHIRICKDPRMTQNGTTVFSRIGGTASVAFRVISHPQIYHRLMIKHPSLPKKSRGWFSHSVQKLDVAMSTVEDTEKARYRTDININIKQLEERDFAHGEPFLVYVYTETSDKLPYSQDSVLFTFRLEKLDSLFMEPEWETNLLATGRCDKDWEMMEGRCYRVFEKTSWTRAYMECEKREGSMADLAQRMTHFLRGDIMKKVQKIWLGERTWDNCYVLEYFNGSTLKKLENCSEPHVFLCARDMKGPVQLCPDEEQPQIRHAGLGQTLRTSVCLVSYSPPYVTGTTINDVQVFDLAKVESEVKKEMDSSKKYTLSVQISNIQEEDYGKITFTIRNGYGDLTYDLQLKHQSPPECPSNIHPKRRGVDYITVSWQPESDGGSSQSFHVYYTANNFRWHKIDAKQGETAVTATCLRENTDYYFRVVSYNRFSAAVNEASCSLTLFTRTERRSTSACSQHWGQGNDVPDPRADVEVEKAAPENNDTQYMESQDRYTWQASGDDFVIVEADDEGADSNATTTGSGLKAPKGKQFLGEDDKSLGKSRTEGGETGAKEVKKDDATIDENTVLLIAILAFVVFAVLFTLAITVAVYHNRDKLYGEQK